MLNLYEYLNLYFKNDNLKLVNLILINCLVTGLGFFIFLSRNLWTCSPYLKDH